MNKTAIRGPVLTFTKDPFFHKPEDSYLFIEDALVEIQDGRFTRVEPYDPQTAEGIRLDAHYRDAVICPGFIDCHVHYPQTQMIGAYGEELLEWLNTYTFVAEQDFADRSHAEKTARMFLGELLRGGTTTASVFCTVHPQSVEAFFQTSAELGARMIAGKVMMDRNAPAALLDKPQSGYEDSRRLIEKWHDQGRQLYAVTPRFAPTSTPEQLAAAARLWREYPGTYLQTHLSENLGELAWVKELFPEQERYLEVYEKYGLLGPRSVFGHCIHIDERDFNDFNRQGAAMAHCPTSNLFLGSGFFKLAEAKKAGRPVRVGLGTDVGGGTSLSMLETLNEAYKVARMNGRPLNSIEGFYLATRGGAEALDLADRIGSIAPGYEADFVVLDLKATPLMEFRQGYAKTLAEKLFVLMTIGDDRAVKATYLAGRKVHERR
ncbi:guanine deaminase [Deltaproteobacteria bacterium OttesenSCG-928-M10]|nr:guanine deaminase [Deltaproteobacteria bacterium OttesenSCG-928-M10]